jgi:hypothetical protein
MGSHLVSLILHGSTSRGPFLIGSTSGGPFLMGFTSRGPIIMNSTSGGFYLSIPHLVVHTSRVSLLVARSRMRHVYLESLHLQAFSPDPPFCSMPFDTPYSFISHLTYPLLLTQVANAPPGTQACTFDIEKFHRTCAVLPAHKPWLVVQGLSNDFYIDHTHPFGAAAASSNAGMIANAIVDIWQAEGVRPVLKYEDDLKIFRYPTVEGIFQHDGFRYDYDRDEALSRISSLCVPWHKEKGDPEFLCITNFIGFRWDLPNRHVALPEEKRLKFYNRVRIFLDCFSGTPCSLLDIQKIHGSLCHVAFVYTQGRSRLPSLSNFIASFMGNEFTRRYAPKSMITDLKWWLQALDISGFYRKLSPRASCRDMGLFVDASTSWGIGIVIAGRWAAFKLHENWKIEGRDICWLETVAVEILVYILDAMGISNTTLLIHSDNQGTIGSLGKGRSRNFHINLSIRRTYVILASQFITPELIYIASENNPADPISRGELGSEETRITTSFSLPDELQHVLIHVP